MAAPAAPRPAGPGRGTGAGPPPGPTDLLVADAIAVTPPGAEAPAVAGLSLRLPAGEWLALAGENGGGKTSLLLALSGLWPLSAGRLTLAGEAFGPDRRGGAGCGVAVVLQDPSSQLLQPTLGEELAFSARNLGAPAREVEAEVARWREALGLDEDPFRDPATLSAGRQQLALIVAALATRPRLLLADEATAHLDAATRRRVRAAIAAAVGRGLAVVWATQDPEELAAAHRTLVVGRASDLPALPSSEGPAHVGPDGPPTRVALRLEISRPDGGRGPRIGVADPVSIPVPHGAVTVLLGPNGVGKSVLLAVAAGLIETPQVRVHRVTPAAQPPIMALQYPELQVFEDAVADELAFAAVARGRPREAVLAEASGHLDRLGLDAGRLLARRTWSLSTGEKRLIEVVGALVAPAGLVLLDEPTAGLDPQRRRGLGDLVRRRASSDPVLVATQDAAWADALGARPVRLGN